MGLLRTIRTKIIQPVLSLLGDKNAATDAAHATDQLVQIVLTPAEKLVAYLRTTTVGTAALNVVSDLNGSRGAGLSGTDKFEKAVADVLPIAISFLTDKTDVKAEASAIEDAVRQLVQGSYNSLLSALKGFVSTILKDLGIE